MEDGKGKMEDGTEIVLLTSINASIQIVLIAQEV